MGRKDSITKKYLAQPKVFADAFNYFIFDGKQVIRPGDLKEQDPGEIAVIKKAGKLMADQKIRDLLKLCTIRRSKKATLVLLGLESQDLISYIMPVRDNLYDAINYWAQVDAIKMEHREKGDLKPGAEFRLNLISPSEIKDFRKFSSQLGLVMEVIKNSDDKEGCMI